MSHPIQQLTGLPRELLGLIVDSTLPSDQLCLCTTSKLFNSLAVRSLYRNIILRESTDIIRLCKTLVCNSATACAARSLNMSLPIKAEPTFFKGFYKLIAAALSRTVRLVSLGILFFDIPYGDVLDGLTFPSIITLRISMTSPESVVSFLTRHSSIQSLHLLTPFENFHADYFASLRLPKLVSFSGPAAIAHRLLPNTSAALVHIVWDVSNNDYDRIISAVGENPIDVLDNTTLGWSLELAESVSRHLPGLVCVAFRNGFPVERPALTTQDFMLSLENVLPLFTNLQSLALTRLVSLDGPGRMSDLDKEFECVVKWGGLCPTLRTCSLPSGILWCRIRDTAWFPDEGHPLRNRWLVNILSSGTYPRMDIIYEELAHHAESLEALEFIVASRSLPGMQRLFRDDMGIEESESSVIGNAGTDSEGEGDSEDDDE